MNQRLIAAAAAGGAALALAACAPPHPHHWMHGAMRTISTLDCPDHQGDMTRTGAAADGKTCNYVDNSGSQITLQLISLDNDDAHAALAPLETRLRAELPTTTADVASAKGSGDDRVNIDVPGFHIHVNGKEGADHANASVNIQNGETVVTQGKGGGGVTIDAHDKGAEIHVSEPGGGVRQTFVLASDTPGPHGYRFASYQARGPSGGPIVVASILSKSDDHDDERHDLGGLLRLNVGG